MGVARTTYTLGWAFFAVALIERGIITASQGMAETMRQRGVLPFNFLELSLLFFVISIAAGHCCPPADKK